MPDNARVQFAVFPNNYKQKDTHPDHRGSMEISEALLREMFTLRQQGKLPILEIAMWNREGKESGKPYMGGSISVDEYRMKEKYGAQSAANEPDPFNDPLPTEQPPAADDDPFAGT